LWLPVPVPESASPGIASGPIVVVAFSVGATSRAQRAMSRLRKQERRAQVGRAGGSMWPGVHGLSRGFGGHTLPWRPAAHE